MPSKTPPNFQSQVDVRSPSQTHGKNPYQGLWQNTIATFKNGVKRIFPGGPVIGEYQIDGSSTLQTPYAADIAPMPTPDGQPVQTEGSIGAAGTAIVGGFLSDLGDYKPGLSGSNAFPTWEQMRRSDPDVYAGLLACKLPVRAATFQVVPGANENDPNRDYAIEIAKMVEDNLFGGLETITSTGFYQTQDFGRVIENAQLMLDFGCACDEVLWCVDGNSVKVRRLAPRLPITFFRFWPDVDGETMLALEQYGYRGDSFVNVVLPAEKINYYVREQEGANYFGFSILRRAYQPWYFKTRLYAIDGIALERNAMGTPWIKMAQGYSKEDRAFATKFATLYSGHENTGLVTPDNWDFQIVGTKGRLRDPKTSIQHYSNQILKSMMAGFLDLGNTQTGSRSLAGDLIGLFKVGLNEQARNIANTMNNSVIRRLVDYNYGDSRKQIPYPKLVVSNIVAVDFLDVADKIKNLAQWQADVLRPDPELEAHVRRELGLPLATQTRPRIMPAQVRLETREDVTPEQAEEQVLEISEGKVDVKNNPDLNPKPSTPQPAQPAAGAKSNLIPTHPNRPDKADPSKTPPPPTKSGSNVKASEIFFGTEQINYLVETLQLLSDKGTDARSIAVDFDGVISIEPDHEQHIHKAGKFGQVSQNAAVLLQRLHDAGFKIVIHTARKDLMNVHDYLVQHSIPFDDVTNRKPASLAYLDDRGLHIDWGADYDPAKVEEVFHRLRIIAEQHGEDASKLK